MMSERPQPFARPLWLPLHILSPFHWSLVTISSPFPGEEGGVVPAEGASQEGIIQHDTHPDIGPRAIAPPLSHKPHTPLGGTNWEANVVQTFCSQ